METESRSRQRWTAVAAVAALCAAVAIAVLCGTTEAKGDDKLAAKEQADRYRMNMELARICAKYEQFKDAGRHYGASVDEAIDAGQRAQAMLEFGRLARRQGKDQLALTRMQEAAKIAPEPQDRCAIYPELIILQKASGRWDEAEATISRFVADACSDEHRKLANMLTVQVYGAQGKLPALAARLELERVKVPDNAAALDLLGSIYEQMRLPEKAADAYQALADLRPGSAGVLARLADAQRACGKFDIAAVAYQRIVDLKSRDARLDPDSVRALAARMYAAANQYDKAARWVDAIGAGGRPDAAALAEKADLYAAIKMPRKAVECLDSCARFQTDPADRARLLFKAADLLAAAGDSVSARERFRKIAADPAAPQPVRDDAQRRPAQLNATASAARR